MLGSLQRSFVFKPLCVSIYFITYVYIHIYIKHVYTYIADKHFYHLLNFEIIFKFKSVDL